MLSPTDIRPAVKEVLLTAPDALTSYDILENLPSSLRDTIIAERGMPGAGSGNSYSAASLVTDAIEGLLPSTEPPYRVYVHGQAVFTVAGQTISPGNSAIALYRLNPPPTVDNVTPSLPTPLSDAPLPVKSPWYDNKKLLWLWLFLFWPVAMYGFIKSRTVAKKTKYLTLAGGLVIYAAMGIIVLSNPTSSETATVTTDYSEPRIITEKVTVAAKPTPKPSPPSAKQIARQQANEKRAIAEEKAQQKREAARQQANEKRAVAEEKAQQKRGAARQVRLLALKSYMGRMADLSGEWGVAYQNITSTLGELGNDTSLLQDGEWRATFALAVVRAQMLSKEIQSLENVPADAKEHYRLWRKAARESDTGLNYIVRGVDKQDGDAMKEGITYLNRASGAAQEANAELDNIKSRIQ